MSEEQLIKRLMSNTLGVIKGKRLLVLCDTTEYNIHNHLGRITDFLGLGSTSNNDTKGFFAHNQLCVERESKNILGWADTYLFNRSMDNKPFTRENMDVPIKEKESNKWLEPSVKTRDILTQEASHCLYVMDREADIYSVIASIENKQTDYLIRARHNRKVINRENKKVNVKQDINTRSIKARIKISVNGESRNRKKREAECEVRYEKYLLCRSQKIKDKENYPKQIKSTLIWVKETNSCPKDESPIEWLLWTSEEVEDLNKVIELLRCYAARWIIEEAHRLLKTKGFNIEATELESGKSIRKLLLLGMEASIKVMQLKSGRSGDTELQTKDLFNQEEMEFLEIINESLEGKTEKLKNKYSKENIAWASWIIARLGGWKGYDSQRKPGTITFKRGLDIFYYQFEGYIRAKEFLRSV